MEEEQERGASGAAHRLERLVRRHRATIAVVFPVVGATVLVASRRLDHPALELLASSTLGLVVGNAVMALPLVAGLLPLLDRRAIGGLAVVAAFGYVVESVGVATGWPYGAFGYQTALGPTAFDVPVALPLFWLPILLNGLLLAVRYVGPRADGRTTVAAAAVLLVVGLDGVLDPGAVALGFWGWDDPGRYYGVPLRNFAGWVLSGGVGVGVIALTLDLDALEERIRGFAPIFDTLVTFLLFWGVVNAVYVQVVPVAGVLLLAGLLLATEQPRYRSGDLAG